VSEPVQVVWREAPVPVEEVVLEAAATDLATAFYARFDPRRTRLDVRRAPLLRGYVAFDADFAAGAGRWLLMLLDHHLIGDHTTGEVLQAEIAAHLAGRAAELPAPLPFRTFVAQARLGGNRAADEAYFRALLGDVTEPTAPFGVVDVQGEGGAIVEGRVAVAAALGQRLRAVARALGVSAATVCHVAWAAVLAKVAGRTDVVFGTVLFGRMGGGAGADRVPGLFMNTLPVRVQVDGTGVEASVRAMQRQLAALLEHEHASLALAQRASGVAAPTPLFSAVLNYRHITPIAPAAGAAGAAAETWMGIEMLRGEERTNYPLVLSVDDLGEAGFGFTTLVAVEGVDPARVGEWMHTALADVVAALEGAPETALRGVGIVPAAERRQVVEEWNQTAAAYPSEQCVHELFEAQVARTPDAVAVVDDAQQLTYAEVNARANRLAQSLRREYGVGPEVRVALCLERSIELVVAVLGVLKAGGAYVPLDPSYPPARLEHILRDAAAKLVLSTAAHAEQISFDCRVVLMSDPDSIERNRASFDPGTPDSRVTAANLAYVIFTSGSTGTPKGVMNTHDAIVRRLRWGWVTYPYAPGEAVIQKTPVGFVDAVAELLSPLLHGVPVVVAPTRLVQDPPAFVAMMAANGITRIILVPSLLRALLAEHADLGARLPTLRLWMVSGEAVTRDLVLDFHAACPGARFINLYGASEVATVDATVAEFSADTRATTLIGRPIDNTRVYVLDAAGEPAPIGVAGELYVGGTVVARGYVNRPGLTAARFVPDPFGPTPGARLYQMGDLARWRADAQLEYLGRVDFQVKVRGHRVELGEIEAVLGTHPGVRRAVVLARATPSGDVRLIAYYVGVARVEVHTLRGYLADRLPAYMVPSAYVELEVLPLTASGKVDRRALPAHDAATDGAHGYAAAQGQTEETVAHIWAKVLGVERVGRHDDFFASGGHSLLVVQVVSALAKAGIRIRVADVFSHSTVAGLAEQIEGRAELNAADNAIPIRIGGSARPLFLFPEGGGDVRYARVLAAQIDASVPVYALPDELAETPRLRTVEGVVARMVRMIRKVQPSGPYRLAGWSFGGILAYEAATQLIGHDQEIEFVGLIDTDLNPQGGAPEETEAAHDPKDVLLAILSEDLADQADAGRSQLEALVSTVGTGDLEALVHQARRMSLLPAEFEAADFERYLKRREVLARASHHYFPHRISIPVHLFRAIDDQRVDPLLRWQAFLPSERVRVIDLPGTHHSIMRRPNIEPLGEALSGVIRDCTGQRTIPPEVESSPLVTLQWGQPTREALLCIPGAGASATSFSHVANVLDADWPIYGLQPRGLVHDLVPHSAVAACAASYVHAIRRGGYPAGPVHLLGHSHGGWVALEMAFRLREIGRHVLSLTIVDSNAPDDDSEIIKEYDSRAACLSLIEVLELTVERSLEIEMRDIETLGEADMLRLLHGRLVRIGFVPPSSAPELLRGPFRAFAAALRTTYTPRDVYPEAVRLVLANDVKLDAAANRVRQDQIVERWRRWAPKLTVDRASGHHMSILRPPQIGAWLSRALLR
jgi:amino acid adenylation domain-containing protein